MVYDDMVSVGLGIETKAPCSFFPISVQLRRGGYSYDCSNINIVTKAAWVVVTFSACDMKATKVHQCPAYD